MKLQMYDGNTTDNSDSLFFPSAFPSTPFFAFFPTIPPNYTMTNCKAGAEEEVRGVVQAE